MPSSRRNKKSTRQTSSKSFSTLEAISTPVVVINLRTKRFAFCNSAFEELSGYLLAEVKTLSWIDLFTEKDSARAKALHDLLLENSGEIAEHDLTFRKKSGRRLAVNLFAKSMPSVVSKHFLLISVHDISTVKRLENEKEVAYKEMSHIAKLADIGRLAAGVAHELNNPLMIIQGFAENIEASIADDTFDVQELKWQLNPILKATDRMSKIISQLTRMSREDDQMSLVTVNLAEIVEDVIRLTRNQLSYNEVHIKKTYADDVLVRCDPNQIEQILLNIFNNAVHALLKVKNHRLISIRIHKMNGLYALSIHNNGPHVPDNIKEKIMTPFFTTKEVGEGTGLGLSVSYGIMKAHGGDLTFSSKKNFGTEFNLIFPKVDVIEVSRKNANGIGVVVDDDDLARDIIANKLRRYGFKILEAINGEEALKILKSRSDVDFVFTDAKMPVMDGASLVKNIRTLDRQILIYAITGYTGIRSIESELTRHGINGFLAKPLDHEKFSNCIKQILDRIESNKQRAA